jgi:small subunit ribosomal protein S7
MSRRQRAVKREIPADPRFGSTTVTKFINSLMLDGKKSTAERIFYDAMQVVEEKTGQPAINVFKQALNNVKPVIEVKSRRVGGATYQVPVEVRPERRNALAQKWLITFARARGDKTMAERLASELMAAARNEGNAIKKKDDTHRMAEANKAFAHYRW